LSGISFYDRDVWLDELWDCAPWPALVTLAACNSSQSLVHEGDEHIGLTTTLLAAGARTVIGSIWPVRDEDAAGLLTAFYRNFLAVNQPAKALALAQREAVNQSEKLPGWSSFLCVGQP
jgi:CHAT domain-containing protein